LGNVKSWKYVRWRLNPWIAAILNFFFPGIGFIYCGVPLATSGILLVVVGCLLLWASFFVPFSFTETMATAMVKPLTLDKFVSTFHASFLLGVLGYVATEYINRVVDRCRLGIVLGIFGGVMFLSERVTFVYALNKPDVVLYYFAGAAIVGFLLILGTLMALKGRRVGGLLMLLVSLLFPMEYVMLIPWIAAIPGYLAFSVSSPWLFFGLIGSLLILKSLDQTVEEA